MVVWAAPFRLNIATHSLCSVREHWEDLFLPLALGTTDRPILQGSAFLRVQEALIPCTLPPSFCASPRFPISRDFGTG